MRRSWGTGFREGLFQLLLVTGPLFAATIQVQPGGPIGTIEKALELANDGDTIVVEEGRYPESLSVRKSVRMIGRGLPTISGRGKGDVIAIIADDVEIEGFEVTGSGNDMLHSDAGIKVVGARARILHNLIAENLFGVYLKSCIGALVEDNEIRGRADIDIGRRGAGVHFYDSEHNRVRGNKVHHVRDGVYFDHSDFNQVEGNEFSYLRYGVHYMYCNENSFVRNIFRDSIAGVAVMYSEKVVFRENQILNNREGFNAFGLLLKDCIDSLAEDNVILNNVNGIFLDNSHRNQFRRNLVAYNDVAIMLYASALENRFSANDFVGNQALLFTVGKADAEWSADGIGNYYSDYSGYDLGADGIGDVPHRLQNAFEYLLGSRPRLRLYLNSPAADAMALAERSFPLVPSSEEIDRAPSMKPISGARLRRGEQDRTESPNLPWVSLTGAAMLFGAGWLGLRLRT